MFLLNSRLGLFSASLLLEPPLFRSYRVILQSSLTRIISRVCGFSPRLRVSVYGTGTIYVALEAFLGSVASLYLRTPISRL